MALELCRRDGIEPLTAFRHLQGWSQEEATQAYNARLGLHVGDAGHLTRQRLGKLENWPSSGVPPALTELVGLGSLYHTAPRSLLTPEAIAKLAPTVHVALIDHAAPPPIPLSHQRSAPPGDLMSPEVPADVIAPVVAAHQSTAFHAAWQSSDVGAQVQEQIRSDLAQLTRDYMHRPLRRMFVELVLTRDRLFGLMSVRRRIGDSRQLLANAALTLTLLARVTDDLGHPQAGERHAQVARSLAEDSGCPQLVAWACATESSLAYWRSDARRCVELAERGLRVARGSLAARLLALKARAWAKLGDAPSAVDGIRRAEDIIPDPDDNEHGLAGGVLAFPSSLRRYLASTAYLWMGDAPAAEREALAAVSTRGVDGRPELYFGDLALARIGLAKSRLMGRGRDVEGAREALAPVLAMGLELRIAALRPGLASVENLLSTPKLVRSSAVEPLYAAVRQFLVATDARSAVDAS